MKDPILREGDLTWKYVEGRNLPISRYQSLELKEKKFYPGEGLEPGSLAFRANALPLSYLGQVRIHDRINLLELSFLTSELTKVCCYYVPQGHEFIIEWQILHLANLQTTFIWTSNFQLLKFTVTTEKTQKQYAYRLFHI